MRGLLDINVLIALADADHSFHERAHAWYGKNKRSGWASCPLTENGMVRIMTHPNYHPGIRYSAEEIISLLETFSQGSDHAFWVDDLSLLDRKLFKRERILGSRQVTDIYLLALAAKHGGRLVTFDEGINTAAVRRFTADKLCIIP
ncbi:MAG: TA system VapC family ribonuclease toxin [Oceanipulchritudo sp.]